MTPTHPEDSAIAATAALLLAARAGGPRPRVQDILPLDRRQAYALQDAQLGKLGPVGGWKVGAKGPDAHPACAPLPAAGLVPSGGSLTGPQWALRGVEVELAFRLGRDLAPEHPELSAAELASAIDAVLPVIEIVETRLADWPGNDPLVPLADLQSHGALVLGPTYCMAVTGLDLRRVHARLQFDGQTAADTVGGNPALDVWRLLGWLAFHCAQRGLPLRAGQIITTGSCTGMLFAPAGTRVTAELTGLGQVSVQL